MRHGLRNYERKMMHDMLMQKDFFFLKDLSKFIVNIVEENGFI